MTLAVRANYLRQFKKFNKIPEMRGNIYRKINSFFKIEFIYFK